MHQSEVFEVKILTSIKDYHSAVVQRKQIKKYKCLVNSYKSSMKPTSRKMIAFDVNKSFLFSIHSL